MDIRAPPQFRGPEDLSDAAARQDPRDSSVTYDGVTIDLRECKFFRPPAALWCAIFPLLWRSRGVRTVLRAPYDERAFEYLAGIGLYRVLAEQGVLIDEHRLPRWTDSKIILPLTRLASWRDAEDAVNRAYEVLQQRGWASPELNKVVGESFGEIALNAFQHSGTRLAYALVQFYEFEKAERFAVSVADGGIGIRAALSRNPQITGIPFDWLAIDKATLPFVSGTGDPHRGNGLAHVSKELRRPHRNLYIQSGLGALTSVEGAPSKARPANTLFPGTLVYGSIRTKQFK